MSNISSTWIIIGVLVVLVVWIIMIYNGLVAMRQRVNQSFADIDVQLKQRHDLIPNLVETVKGYAGHERGTLEAVIKARQTAVAAPSIDQKVQAENALSGTLRQLFALSESYPDLKANQNFQALQEELVSTEDKVGYARQFYNDSVFKYNAKIQSFPGVIFANVMGFKPREYFEADDESRGPVRVEF